MTRASSRVLDIHLLGGFTVALGDELLPPLPSRFARLLFAYLALTPDQAHPRVRLAAELWPDLEESRARKRLSHTLWQLQDALAEVAPGRRYVEATPETVQLGDAPSRIDVHDFERGLDEVTARGVLDPESIGTLRRCVEVYRGDFLAGYYEPWVITEQERLDQRYVDALTKLVTAAKRRSNFEEALTYARRLTHHAPLREDVHREVMRLYVLMGRHGEALAQYERCRAVMADELGADPEAATTELAERITRTRRARPPDPTPEREIATSRLVGRRVERQRILDRLDRSLSRRGETVLVEGEPGIGKTRLLAQVADDARWRGFTVLYGSCLGEATARPYQALVDALQPELHPVRVAQLRASLGDQWLRDAGRLIPGLTARDATPNVSLDAAESSARMRESLVRLVLALSDVAPTALVIDDLQWADSETLDVLSALAQRHDHHPLLVVLSYRDQEARASSDVWEVLRSLDRARAPERIGLRALSAFETAELVGDAVDTSDVPASFSAAIQRESGGNPLYVVELLRVLRDRGALTRAPDELEDLAVPSTSDLHAAIGERVDQVGADAMRVLRLAAVLGAETDTDTLTAAAPVARDRLPLALDDLLRRNLLEPRGDGVAFTHAAARAVVLERLSSDDRRELNLAAADALERTGSDQPEALSHHLLQAGEHARALPHLRKAAERAVSLSAYRSARRLLDRAAELLDEVPVPVADRFAILAQQEHVLGVLGDRTAQAAVLDELTALAGTDRERRAETLRRTALLQGLTDRYADAEATAQQAVAECRELGAMAYGSALVVLGRIRSWAGRNHDAVPVLAEAADVLVGDDVREGEARYALGTACTYVQDYPSAIEALERAREVYDRAGDQRGVIEVTGALGDVHATLGDIDVARHEHEQAIEGAREIGYLWRASVSQVNLANLLQFHGDLATALTTYDAAAEGFTSLGNGRGVATVRLNRAWLRHRWLGDDEAAGADAEAARGFFAGIGNLGTAALAGETLASIAHRGGDLDTARTHLDRAWAGAEQDEDRQAQVQVHRGLAELALAAEDGAAAVEAAGSARATAAELGMIDLLPELDGILAHGHLLAGQLPEARAAIDLALAALGEAREPHVVLHRAALVTRAEGDGRAAQEHAERAAAVLEEALAGFPEATRERALRDVPVHAQIAAAATVHTSDVAVRVARADAPTGRALEDDETVVVRLQLAPPADDPHERRRQLLRIVEQTREQGGSPTLSDLVDVLGVSRATVRRDLSQLRAEGHEVPTRGSRPG